jgi:alcohol sulfotransferase
MVAHYLAARYEPEFEVTASNVFEIVPDHITDPVRGYPAFRYRNGCGSRLFAVCHQPWTVDLHRNFPVLFLARNPYDVVVSAYFHLTREKQSYTGSLRDFISHPRLGLDSWIGYMNRWAPELLRHRDVTFLSYGQLRADPAASLCKVLEFVDEQPDESRVAAAVESSQALRDSRAIRTGQEGNFWDHLQPEEIFSIQDMTQRGLSGLSVSLLEAIGVEIDPFPRLEP